MSFHLSRSLCFLLLALVTSIGKLSFAATPPVHPLPGHLLPSTVTLGAHPLQVSEDTLIPLAVRLPMRNSALLERLLVSLYAPGDPLYGQYLTPDEFAAQFGATEDDFNQVVDYFQGLGCTLGERHKNRLLLDVKCSRTIVEHAFSITLSHWSTVHNERVQTINQDPSIPDGLPIEAIHGLTSVSRHPLLIKKLPDSRGIPAQAPSAPSGLSPSDIKTAYNLNGVPENGSGQTLALFELAGYTPADIKMYQSTFGISTGVPLQNILVDGYDGSPGQGADEVTLDIDLMMALAPGARQILVYEGPNTDAGVIDVYQKIATDNSASQVSTSWGIAEGQTTPVNIASENKIFMQMAAQGQSIFSASGDTGANGDGTVPSVLDPASQPFVTGVGGTTLVTHPDHAYSKESTWWNGVNGSGGGISAVWSLPGWQRGVVSVASGGSVTHRNVPDVSLDGDPVKGYSIYFGGAWGVYGGTSCGAPLWAAFTALVNQKREDDGLTSLGYANPALYRIGSSERYSSAFHDIADGSTNGKFHAVPGYDLTTGWGSFNGESLLMELESVSAASPTPTPTAPSRTPGCNRISRPMSREESAGAALSLGLPISAGFFTRRKRKVQGERNDC